MKLLNINEESIKIYRAFKGFDEVEESDDFDDYYAKVNETLLCAVQIESVKGVENVDEIATVKGIDLFFIGHSDLSSDYGCYKQFADPRMLAAEERIIQAARRNGKATHIFAASAYRICH